MVEQKKKSKSVFLEALILTLAVFFIGLFIGVLYEGEKINEISDYYTVSEILLMDSLATSKLSSLTGSNYPSCDVIMDSNRELANRIYTEAKLLEKYEASGKLTETIKLVHKKYDLLRTLLWINLMDVPEECKKNVSTIVYLYEYETKDLTERAENAVWSKVLLELKQEKGEDIILIPIAADSGLISLNSLISRFNIEKYPVVIIDDKTILSEINSAEELEKYLKE